MISTNNAHGGTALSTTHRRPKGLVLVGHPNSLTLAQHGFCLNYLANGDNATAAYKATHPHCRSEKAATVEGHRTLVKPRVQQYIQHEIEARNRRLRMLGDEALETISVYARADIGELFTESGQLKVLHQMPLNVRRTIKSIKHTPAGPVIQLHDALKANRLMAIAAGELKPQHQHKHTFDHAAYLGAAPPAGDDE